MGHFDPKLQMLSLHVSSKCDGWTNPNRTWLGTGFGTGMVHSTVVLFLAPTGYNLLLANSFLVGFSP